MQPNLTLYSFTKNFIFKQKILFLSLAILHLAWTIDNTIIPYIFSKFLDEIIKFTGAKDAVWPVVMPWIIAGVLVWILVEVMFRLHDYIASRTYPLFERRVRMYMVKYINGHSYEFFQNNFSGSIATKINDMTDGLTRISQLIITLFIPSLCAFIIGGMIFASIHPSFAILLFVWCTIHIGICLFYARKCHDYSKEHSESRSDLTGKIVDNFTNIFAVKSYAKERGEYKYIKKFQIKESNLNRRTYHLTFKVRLIQAVICFILQGVLDIYLLVKFWQLDMISTSDIVYIFYTSWGLVTMAWISGIELPNFFHEIGKCNQALELIKIEHATISKESVNKFKIKQGEISFHDVTFRYQRNNNLFQNQNVTIEAGSQIGLVGYSGSGKTSFVNLILRYFDIDEGNILIDGQNIVGISLEDLRNQIAFIPQETLLFHRSIAENIAFAKDGSSQAEVVKAAKLSHSHDFIMSLPEGYKTLVGERGVKLSGGQRQRIAIARAFLKDAPIIILDEATSALDSVTEDHIQKSLEKLTKGKTTIIIAHRLSTLKHVDRILVFDKGSIIQDGNHKNLSKGSGHYARMWEKQAGGFI
ncbi:MAG: ABC transporter ATP-binding protein [Rickettsiales bacterium]|jgi:ATP-binding cassette, subfamily B, bacterial|nr:ABC transporter ATP-binding protein [Rickettsiales bacterium]